MIRSPRRPPAGAFAIFEEIPPMVDTPLHIQAHEDELFYGRIRARSRLREAAFRQALANEPIAR